MRFTSGALGEARFAIIRSPPGAKVNDVVGFPETALLRLANTSGKSPPTTTALLPLLPQPVSEVTARKLTAQNNNAVFLSMPYMVISPMG